MIILTNTMRIHSFKQIIETSYIIDKLHIKFVTSVKPTGNLIIDNRSNNSQYQINL